MCPWNWAVFCIDSKFGLRMIPCLVLMEFNSVLIFGWYFHQMTYDINILIRYRHFISHALYNAVHIHLFLRYYKSFFSVLLFSFPFLLTITTFFKFALRFSKVQLNDLHNSKKAVSLSLSSRSNYSVQSKRGLGKKEIHRKHNSLIPGKAVKRREIWICISRYQIKGLEIGLVISVSP